MGFIVKIEANDTIELGVDVVKSVVFNTDTPNDSNARSTDLGMGVTIKGKILAKIMGGADETAKLPIWALIPAENGNCYGKVTIKVIAAGKCVREIEFSAAYVISYKESFGDESGVGEFTLVLRQKKDLNDEVVYQGGYDY